MKIDHKKRLLIYLALRLRRCKHRVREANNVMGIDLVYLEFLEGKLVEAQDSLEDAKQLFKERGNG